MTVDEKRGTLALHEELRRHEKNRRASRSGHDQRYLGHRTNKGFYVLLLLLLLVIAAILLFHFLTLQRLSEERLQAQEELVTLRAERDHYREAYEIALADARAFGRLYDAGYKGDAGSKTDGSGTNSPPLSNTSALRLPRESVWAYYHAQGVISDTCIPVTKVVQTPSNIVEIVIVARGKKGAEWPRLNLLVDATTIATFIVETEQDGVHKALVELLPGTHRIDLVYLNGETSKELTVPLLRIGDRTIENEVSVLDYGEGFSLFDCQETGQGATLKRSGAMRFRIEKV